MPFYEIVYEPGTKSVAYYEDDNEANSALNAHLEKAISGQPATPQSDTHPSADAPQAVGTWAAERPVKVYVYDTHPADFVPEVDTSQLSGTGPEMVEQLRQAISPLAENPGVQDSQYKQEADRELDISNLGGTT
jgi:hypothetical protein